MTIELLDVESYQTAGSPRNRSAYSRQAVNVNINLMQDRELENLLRDNENDPSTRIHLMSRIIASLRS
jgi:hypothetical protein